MIAILDIADFFVFTKTLPFFASNTGEIQKKYISHVRTKFTPLCIANAEQRESHAASSSSSSSAATAAAAAAEVAAAAAAANWRDFCCESHVHASFYTTQRLCNARRHSVGNGQIRLIRLWKTYTVYVDHWIDKKQHHNFMFGSEKERVQFALDHENTCNRLYSTQYTCLNDLV